MTRLDVVLDVAAQGEAVHFGHQHVANHEINLFLFQYFQGLLAVCCTLDLVFVGQQALQKQQDLLMVVYDQQGIQVTDGIGGGSFFGRSSIPRIIIDAPAHAS